VQAWGWLASIAEMTIAKAFGLDAATLATPVMMRLERIKI
jgi:hypothetical protein